MSYPVEFRSVCHSDVYIDQEGNSQGSYVKGYPGGLFMPESFLDVKEDIYHMKPSANDVWIVTFPKSGTTWTQELAWLLLNNLDYETAISESVMSRVHFLEYYSMLPRKLRALMEDKYIETGKVVFSPTIAHLDNQPKENSRIIKTHLPLSILPPNLLDTSKIIYVARNPRDVVVSYYHHHRLIQYYKLQATFEDFFESFLRDEVRICPYWPHVLEAYNKKDHPNMCFLYFEDMKKNLPEQIKKVAKFLGKEVCEDNVMKLNDFLKFENAKTRFEPFQEQLRTLGFFTKESCFYRKGEVGDHKNYFTPEMDAKMKTWMETNIGGTGFYFPEH